jgi:hypothetical protein
VSGTCGTPLHPEEALAHSPAFARASALAEAIISLCEQEPDVQIVNMALVSAIANILARIDHDRLREHCVSAYAELPQWVTRIRQLNDGRQA